MFPSTRYIGVLNVSFETEVRRKPSRKEKADNSSEPFHTGDGPTGGQASEKRVISQSMESSSAPTPTVVIADNRHILPKAFLNAPSKARSFQDEARLNSEFTFRPSLEDKHAASWGYTTVNKKLRDSVFQEAFLDNPIPVKRHKKPADQSRTLPSRTKPITLRPSNSESALKTVQQSLASGVVDESMRRKAMSQAAEQNHALAEESQRSKQVTAHPINNGDNATGEVDAEAEFKEVAGTSAPEKELSMPPTKRRQRRYSSGGLRRKPAEVGEKRGDMEYYEEADDVVQGTFSSFD